MSEKIQEDQSNHVRFRLIYPTPLTSDPSKFISHYDLLSGEIKDTIMCQSQKYNDIWEVVRMIAMGRLRDISKLVSLQSTENPRQLEDGEIMCSI